MISACVCWCGSLGCIFCVCLNLLALWTCVCWCICVYVFARNPKLKVFHGDSPSPNPTKDDEAEILPLFRGTALSFAAHWGNEDIVCHLVSRGHLQKQNIQHALRMTRFCSYQIDGKYLKHYCPMYHHGYGYCSFETDPTIAVWHFRSSVGGAHSMGFCSVLHSAYSRFLFFKRNPSHYPPSFSSSSSTWIPTFLISLCIRACV